MKFSIAVAVSALAASISAGALPARFTLVESTYCQQPRLLSHQRQPQPPSHPFISPFPPSIIATHTNQPIVESQDGTSASYLARMQDAADVQTIYAMPDGIERIGLTAPRSTEMPEGAKTTGFGMNEDGLLTFNNRGWFAIDGSTGLIYVDNAEVCNNTDIVAAKVYVKEVDAAYE